MASPLAEKILEITNHGHYNPSQEVDLDAVDRVLDSLRCALADIAFSTDLNLRGVRSRAKEVYYRHFDLEQESEQ
jgi:hypothetical protein